MEVHQLRYFRAVARFRSFTRAAEHEHVAQPSLSQQIRKLEGELGARLFNRLGRKITLTPFGERFEEHARRALAELDGAKQEVEELMGLRQGTVWVGAVPTVAPYLLPTILTAFTRRYPGVTLQVHEDLTTSLVERLSNGDLDLALLSLPAGGPELQAEPLLDDRMLLAVSTRHRLWRQRRRRIAFRDITHEPFLLLKDGHCFRDDVLHICKRSRLSPNVVFEGGQFDTLLAMVAAGVGITLLPEMARAHSRRPGVGLLEFFPPQPRRIVGIVRAREKFLTPGTRAFVDIVKSTLAAQRPL